MDASLTPSLSVQTLEETVVARERFLTGTYVRFALILASLAVVLAGIGIYGVMSYLVSQRVREIGIRMALGAPAVNVLQSVLADGLRTVFFGALFGLAGAGVVAAVLKATLVFPGSIDFLYGVSAFDPLTFLGLSAFLAGVAAIATVVPARRAVKVDPLVALRFE
jgi:ABC-type antimicrobial peptide transport system permease subunit